MYKRQVLISPIVDSLPGEAKASSMSLLHAFYSWGQVLVILTTTVCIGITAVSYTHLDVYKRQTVCRPIRQADAAGGSGGVRICTACVANSTQRMQRRPSGTRTM